MEIILTQIFDLIKNGDKETFKTYFADDALNVSDFEDGWNFLLTQYKGDLLNIDCKFPMGEGTRFVPGERIQTAFTTFNIITNENEYVAYIDFYTQYSSKYPEEIKYAHSHKAIVITSDFNIVLDNNNLFE